MTVSSAAPLSGEPADIHRLAQLGRFVRWLLPVTFVFTGIEALTFIAFPQPAIALSALMIGGYGVWLLIAWRRARRTAIVAFATRMALGMLAIILVEAIVWPGTGPQLTVAAVLPVILVLPYLDNRALRRFIGFTWLVAMFVAVMGEFLPPSFVLPAVYESVFHIAVLAAVFGLGPRCTLAQLIAVAPEPWPAVLADHRTALRVLVRDLVAEAAETRRQLRTSGAAVRESLDEIRSADAMRTVLDEFRAIDRELAVTAADISHTSALQTASGLVDRALAEFLS